MSNCLELIYDRFGIEFYPSDGVQFAGPMMLREKYLSETEVTIIAEQLYLAVGNFPEHTGKHIQTNDTYEDITTTVSEKKDGEQYTVSIHFEFVRPTKTAVTLCEALDYRPYHVVLKQYGFAGETVSCRVVRCEEGQNRVEITEEKGIVKVDVEIQNVDGIQLIG